MQAAELTVDRFSQVVSPLADDVDSIVKLLAAAPERCAPLSADEVRARLSSFRIIRDQWSRQVVGSIALQRVGLSMIELRCVTVAKSARGHGLAKCLMDAVLMELSPMPVRVVCATKIPEFFKRFGFEITNEIQLPKKRRPTRPCQRKRVTMMFANNFMETNYLRMRA